MQDSKKLSKIALLCTVLLAIILLIVGIKYSLSVLLGGFYSVVHFQRVNRQMGSIVDVANFNVGKFVFGFMISLLLLAFPMVVAVIFPNYFDLLTAGLSLFMVKAVIYGSMIVKKEGVRQ